MGILKSRAQKQWEAYFDAALRNPAIPKDTMTSWRLGGSEPRVLNPATGDMTRRNGAQCCGCGQAPRNIKPYRSPIPHDESNHHHHDPPPEDDAPRGYFCSWL